MQLKAFESSIETKVDRILGHLAFRCSTQNVNERSILLFPQVERCGRALIMYIVVLMGTNR